MKKYNKPVVSVITLENSNIITLSGTQAQILKATDTKNTRSALGLNS